MGTTSGAPWEQRLNDAAAHPAVMTLVQMLRLSKSLTQQTWESAHLILRVFISGTPAARSWGRTPFGGTASRRDHERLTAEKQRGQADISESGGRGRRSPRAERRRVVAVGIARGPGAADALRRSPSDPRGDSPERLAPGGAA